MNARRITTALAGSAIAAGILIGGAAQASATPTTPGTKCSAVAMPAVRANAQNLNPLTRAGQLSESQSGLQGPPVRNAC